MYNLSIKQLQQMVRTRLMLQLAELQSSFCKFHWDSEGITFVCLCQNKLTVM